LHDAYGRIYYKTHTAYKNLLQDPYYFLLMKNLFFLSDNRYERIQYECIRCLKAIMNNTVGIKEMLAHHEALTIVARSLEPSKPSVMSEAVKLLGAVCLISSDSHKKVLDAVTMNGEFKGRERFLPIVQGLMNKKNENLRVCFAYFSYFFIRDSYDFIHCVNIFCDEIK